MPRRTLSVGLWELRPEDAPLDKGLRTRISVRVAGYTPGAAIGCLQTRFSVLIRTDTMTGRKVYGLNAMSRHRSWTFFVAKSASLFV